MFGVLRRNRSLQKELHLTLADCFDLEIRAVIDTSKLSRKHSLVQQSLAAATYLTSLVPACEAVGLKIDAVARHEAASILWKQGEVATSVKMLQEISTRNDLEKQSLRVGKAGILAQLVGWMIYHCATLLLTKTRVTK